jgi:hypothetical protein
MVVAGALGWGAVGAVPLFAQSFHPQSLKLHARGQAPRINSYFGVATAASDRFLLVGEPASNDAAANAGAAHLFDAATGRYLRRLTALDANSGDSFGSSVAVAGNWAVVGAPGDDAAGLDSGAAYVFDVRTGRQLAKLAAGLDPGDFFGGSVAVSGNLCVVGATGDDDKGSLAGAAYVFELPSGGLIRKLVAWDGASEDDFGTSVAISGTRVLVGSPWDANPGGNGAGAGYVFDAFSGEPLRKLTAPDPASEDFLGQSVALDGHYALLGAPGDDDQGALSGSAYVLDVRTAVQVCKLRAPDGVAGDQFGRSVALSGFLALVGVAADGDLGTNSGSAQVFDASSGAHLLKLTAPDGAAGALFGRAVALQGKRALVGTPQDDDLGTLAGAAYLFQPLAAPLPLRLVAARGSSAPGTIDAGFSRLGPDVFVNNDGEVALTAQLAGAGASGGRAFGAWNTLAPGRSLDLALRGQDSIGGGVRIAAVLGTLSNRPSDALIHVSLAGTGVTSATNRGLWRDNGTIVSPVLRTGDNPGNMFIGGRLQAMHQVVQGVFDRVAVVGQLLRGSGSGMGETLVTPLNDSVAFFVGHVGVPVDRVYRESDPKGMGTLGQMFGRLAQSPSNIYVALPAWWLPPGGGAPLQQLYAQPSLDPLFEFVSQNEAAPGTGLPSAAFRSFLGESASATGRIVWRASLTGTGVTTVDNEGLWHEAGSPDSLIVRKGQQLDPVGEFGVRVARLLQFWPAGLDGTDRAFFLVRLSGPGVTAANDVALYLWHFQGGMPVIHRLLREGDLVAAPDAPRIGVIQRVDVAPGALSQYVVLASLTGSSSANQALLTGVGSGTSAGLRLPAVRLRKGTLHSAPGALPRTLRSLGLAVTTDATGAGSKGLGQVINAAGQVAVSVEFDNGAREVLTGVP